MGMTALASACSVRPGSMVIFYNGATTLGCAGLSAILAVLAFTRRLPVAKRACIALLVLHPAWTVGSCCDCGMVQTGAALLDAILSTAAFFWDSSRRRL